MDLTQEWQNMSTEIIANDKSISSTNFTIDMESNNLIQSIILKLKWKLWWIRIIDIPVLILAFFTQGDLRLVLIVMFLIYELFRFFTVIEFKKIKTGIDYNANTKLVLKDNYEAIKRALKIEDIFSYTFLPIAGPIGAICYNLYKTNSFEIVFSNPKIYLISILFILFCIPAILIAKRINNKLFSAHLMALKNKIQDLDY
jgi:hypothetical protein